MYYGGEAISTLEMPQSYTCPYCSRMGFTDVTLQEHVTADHQDTTFEVVRYIRYYLSKLIVMYLC